MGARSEAAAVAADIVDAAGERGASAAVGSAGRGVQHRAMDCGSVSDGYERGVGGERTG